MRRRSEEEEEEEEEEERGGEEEEIYIGKARDWKTEIARAGEIIS